MILLFVHLAFCSNDTVGVAIEHRRRKGISTRRCTWKLKNGYYVRQQHGKTNECYSEAVAKQKCEAAQDCKAIATQSNVCGGKWRVTHGGPTFAYYRHWRHYRLKAQECVA